MAKLRIVHNGQQIGEYELNEAQEYFAGRGSQSQIQLPNEKGVSRQHIRLAHENGAWFVEQVSKYGAITFNSEIVPKLELHGAVEFEVPPFLFHFDDGLQNSVQITKSHPATATRTVQISHDYESDPSPEPSYKLEENVPRDSATADEPISSDATRVMNLKPVPFLIIKNLKTRTEDVLKLGEGTTWTAGRHPDCPIAIKDSAISRSHFHIHTENGKFFVTDHGSANSTKVNGDKIVPQSPKEIQSGDVLKVRHVEILFELRDPNYQNQLAMIPAKLLDSENNAENGSYAASSPEEYVSNSEYHYPTNANQPIPHVVRIPPSKGASNPLQKLFENKLRITLVAAIVIILLIAVFGGNGSNPKSGIENNGSVTPNTDPNNPKPIQLTAQQSQQLRDVLNLAKRHYHTQKYELCLEQIETIKRTTPYFEDSKAIETFCLTGLETQKVNMDNDLREQKQLDAENKINSIVEACRTSLKPTTTLNEMETCLQDAIALSPEHPRVSELLAIVESQENAKQAEYEKMIRFKQKKAQGKQLFDQAEAAYKSERWKESLRLFKTFRSGNYPGLNMEQDVASRRLASIETNISQGINEQLSTCQSNMQNGNLKLAYIACAKVLKENPGNAQATEMKRKVLMQMNREMKGLFEDSVLEESLGNVESAKEKWQQIVDKSVPDNDYYKKARSKLKKYGIEM